MWLCVCVCVWLFFNTLIENFVSLTEVEAEKKDGPALKSS